MPCTCWMHADKRRRWRMGDGVLPARIRHRANVITYGSRGLTTGDQTVVEAAVKRRKS